MNICNSEATEVDYFEMLNRWTEASCKRKDVEPSDLAKRDMCAGLYHNIRFHVRSIQRICINTIYKRLKSFIANFVGNKSAILFKKHLQ